MSYADDFEDIGGYYAEQDSYAEDCEEYEGECKKCPNKWNCDGSYYKQRMIENWGRKNGKRWR